MRYWYAIFLGALLVAGCSSAPRREVALLGLQKPLLVKELRHLSLVDTPWTPWNSISFGDYTVVNGRSRLMEYYDTIYKYPAHMHPKFNSNGKCSSITYLIDPPDKSDSSFYAVKDWLSKQYGEPTSYIDYEGETVYSWTVNEQTTVTIYFYNRPFFKVIFCSPALSEPEVLHTS